MVRRNGTLDGAIRAFGKPTSLRRGRYRDCTARWQPIGLRIVFYNLGLGNPCLRQYGYFSNATMVGRHWVTARGLRLGDPSQTLHVRYSPRRFTGSWAWLVTRYSRIGVSTYYPGLAAKVHRGWVTAFRIRYRLAATDSARRPGPSMLLSGLVGGPLCWHVRSGPAA